MMKYDKTRHSKKEEGILKEKVFTSFEDNFALIENIVNVSPDGRPFEFASICNL